MFGISSVTGKDTNRATVGRNLWRSTMPLPTSLMLFELEDDRMWPRLPSGPSNQPRAADGVRYFTLEQAAARSGRPAAELEHEWRQHVRDVWPDEDELFITSGQAPLAVVANEALEL